MATAAAGSTRTPDGLTAVVRPGLTDAAVADRRSRYGPNSVPAAVRHGVVWRTLRQLRDPMLLLLLGAAVLTTWQGDAADTAIILIVVVLNTAVGVAQELRAERAVAALQEMAAPHARVRRDGRDQVVDAADVVPGDVLLLDAGDVVAADAEVAEQVRLETDDSALTGESLAVAKAVGEALFAGTTVVRGRAVATVTRTGAGSTLGRIAGMVAAARPGPTPLQARLTRLARVLTFAALGAALLVVVGGLLRGLPAADVVISATSLAVAAVPESLPAVLTLSLALGARRMARHAAIARELRAVETLGSVTLLATDKTGTLTENRMVAERVWTPEGEYDASGAGYDPEGCVTVRSGSAGPLLDRLLRDIALCNDAELEADPDRPGSWRPVGDPTEAALLALAHRGGRDPAESRAAWPRRQEVPFDSERAWMGTGHRGPGDTSLVVCKGAPDVLLPAVRPSPALAAGAAWAARRAADGGRVLAVVEAPRPPEGLTAADLPAGLELVGLVALTDPPRQDLQPVLAALDGAGIRMAMMTGDHPATAEAIARRVGLTVTPDTVYARVRPEDKLALVKAWQDAGEVVAVTGDGVNDGPALRMADIGVAMGRGGTEVARQAADLVLTDDRLQTVVHAVEEGRRIHDNLKTYLRYALSGGLAEVFVMLLAPFIGFVVPLLPGQILWINMLTHGLPGVALGADPVSPTAMRRPPVPREEPLVDRTVALQVAAVGTLLAAVTITAAVWARADGADWRTCIFLVLGLAQLGVALAVRAPGAGRRNPFLLGAVATAVALQVAGVLVPVLRALLETAPLPPEMWLRCVVLATVPGLVTWLVRSRLRRA